MNPIYRQYAPSKLKHLNPKLVLIGYFTDYTFSRLNIFFVTEVEVLIWSFLHYFQFNWYLPPLQQ